MRKPKTIAKTLVGLVSDAMEGTSPNELFKQLLEETGSGEELLKLLAFSLDMIRLAIVQGILPHDVLDRVMQEHGNG